MSHLELEWIVGVLVGFPSFSSVVLFETEGVGGMAWVQRIQEVMP